ncbi:MAG: hypothetical protein LLG20_16715 [Acidobacteriales bacterium]|nr:hypothetical protein [Terriglobales bacterium]
MKRIDPRLWMLWALSVLIVAVALVSTVLLAVLPAGFAWPERTIAAIVLFVFGLGAAWLAAHEYRQKERYRRLSKKLGSVYEKVQATFEGMKRAERLSALGQLSAGLAHEIRNPLASISGAAAILRRDRSLDPKQARCVDIIANECRRLDGLLTSFLNFARPRAPRFQTVELAAVLDSTLALADHGVHGKIIHFERQVEPKLPPVECDPEQLEQVLLNLMLNAIEASPDGETVTLSASAGDGRITIRVIDRGHGVAPAHVDRLFDPFFTTKEHGTGLGLPVAHQIMRQMGGALQAHGNPDRGMTFSVILPAKR